MKPLYTIKQIKQRTNNGREYISGVVHVDLNSCYDGHETFLDTLSIALVGSELLMDISFDIIGGKGKTLDVKVSGDASEVLNIE